MRQEKQLILDEIREKIADSKGFILTRYAKMNPNLASQFRFDLMKSGGDFEVVRKRVLIKAAEAAGFNLEQGMLEGHIGVVFATQDLLETAKTVFKFKADNEEVLEVLGGRFEGQLYSGKDVEELSKLPSKTELRSQFVGLLEAVPSQLLGVIDALLSSPLHCLENKIKKQ